MYCRVEFKWPRYENETCKFLLERETQIRKTLTVHESAVTLQAKCRQPTLNSQICWSMKRILKTYTQWNANSLSSLRARLKRFSQAGALPRLNSQQLQMTSLRQIIMRYL